MMIDVQRVANNDHGVIVVARIVVSVFRCERHVLRYTPTIRPGIIVTAVAAAHAVQQVHGRRGLSRDAL
jgi:hypothetical protein